MANCEFNRDIGFDCAAIPQGGIENRIIIINYSDWRNSTVTVDGTSKEITSIVLASTIQGYEVQVPKSSMIIANSPLRAVDGIDGFDHTIDIRVGTITQLDRTAISNIRFNKVVIIVPLLNGKSLLYGGSVNSTPSPVGIGMRLSDFQELPGDAATGGTIQFVAKTPDTDPPEISVPTLIAASFDIDDLLTPAGA